MQSTIGGGSDDGDDGGQEDLKYQIATASFYPNNSDVVIPPDDH